MDYVKSVEKFRGLMLEAEKYIFDNPETGYKEYKTDAYLKEQFTKMGYKVVKPNDITGFTATYDSGKQGPTLLIFGELDAIKNSSHECADKQTCAVHACGHNVQCASVLGVAAALKEGNFDICGKVKFCLVPAEEGVEGDYRRGLKEKGIIKYISGKPEYISRGFFEDCDIALMVHTFPQRDDGKKFYFNLGNNGNIRKKITFIGKASHAGGAPHLGVNALNIASTAICAVNSLRETFKDDDHIRVHSILTKGGESVNTVPNEIVLESYVRGASGNAIKQANDKVNRTMACVAAGFGGNVVIEDVIGSMPVHNDKNLIKLSCEVLNQLVGENGYDNSNDWGAICTDFGDISALMPALHAYTCGMSGPLHGSQTVTCDHELSVIDSAKYQLGMILSLLGNNALNAKKVIAEFKPTYTKQEYVAYKNSFGQPKNAVTYLKDGSIKIEYKN